MTTQNAQINHAQAKEIVSLAISELKKKQNEEAMKEILAECDKYPDNPMLQFQIKMGKLIPRVMEILGSQIEAVMHAKVENTQVMSYVAQIQQLSATDLHLGIQVNKVVRTLSGDFAGLYEEDEADEEVEQIE